MSDLISREEVLSTYADWYGYGYKNGFYKLVQQMPPVNPAKVDELEIERERELCRDNYAAQMKNLGYDANGNPAGNDRERKDDYECTKAHEMIEDRLHCRRCGDRVITGEWDDYNYCPKCGKKAKVYETGWR